MTIQELSWHSAGFDNMLNEVCRQLPMHMRLNGALMHFDKLTFDAEGAVYMELAEGPDLGAEFYHLCVVNDKPCAGVRCANEFLSTIGWAGSVDELRAQFDALYVEYPEWEAKAHPEFYT